MRWPSIPLLVTSVALSAPAAALTPLPDFSASRYQGHWYEIAAISGFFRSQCERDVQAQYAAEDDGALTIHNRCHRPDGTMLDLESRGRALFEREDQGEMGPGVLDRSFSGTYR